MAQSECAKMDLEGECEAVFPLLALFPSVTVPPSLSNVNDSREMSSYFSNGVLLFDALSDVAPSYFDSSSISREHPKDNYILKQSNLRKLLRNLQTYLRVEHGKKVCFPITEDTLQDFILKIAKVQHWDHILFLLEVVAAAAVTCDQKAIFVGRVREMPTSHQLILKDLIQRGLAHLQDDNDEANVTASGMVEPEGSEDLHSHDSQDASNNSMSSHHHHHKQHRRHSIDSESEITEMIMEDDGSVPASTGGNYMIQADKELIKQLQNELLNLHKLYTTKENEMALQQQRENELSSKLYELSARHKADMMQAESLVLVRERQVSEEYECKMAELEKTLKNCQASLAENNKYKEQMDEMKDEMDVLKHARDKAIQTEQHILRLKDKLQNLQDVSECLKREEQAHSETIEKCIRLESEMVTLQPLRRQLDDYKGRLVEVEIQLAEFQQDNATWRQKHDLLYQENATLKRGTCQQKEEELALRRQLAANDTGGNDITTSIGTGLSELNPELKAELVRLRKENEQLKVFAGKRENDQVQKMEDKVEDLSLLSQKLKEQYLSNKLALKESMGRENELQQQLTEAIYREEALKTEILSLHTQFESDKTAILTEATRAREELEKDFLSTLSSEQSRLQHQIDEATREKNKIDQRTSAALLDLRQQHDSELDKLRHQHQQRIDEILKNNEEDRKSLMEKGKQLIKKHLTDHEHKLKEMEMKCRETEEKCEFQLDLMKKKMDAFENEAKTKLTATHKAFQSSQERQRVLQDKCEGLEEECGLLKREKSTLENEIDRQRRRRVGSDNGQGYLQYERLQREYQTILNENRQLKEQLHEKYARPLESGQNALKPSSKQNSWADVWATSSSLSLAELRSGYEEDIASLTDEKRELIMKNAAFMTDAKRAQQQVCELEETVGRLHDELTSVKLKLERATEQEL